jgi:hypothetical protein
LLGAVVLAARQFVEYGERNESFEGSDIKAIYMLGIGSQFDGIDLAY